VFARAADDGRTNVATTLEQRIDRLIDENWQRFCGADGPGAGLGSYEP
jgi:hypothetical protein